MVSNFGNCFDTNIVLKKGHEVISGQIAVLQSYIYRTYTKYVLLSVKTELAKIIYDRKAKQSRRTFLIQKHQIVTFLGSDPVSLALQVFFKTSCVNGFLYQFLYHFSKLSPTFSNEPYR
jgi:hypothetical protein